MARFKGLAGIAVSLLADYKTTPVWTVIDIDDVDDDASDYGDPDVQTRTGGDGRLEATGTRIDNVIALKDFDAAYIAALQAMEGESVIVRLTDDAGKIAYVGATSANNGKGCSIFVNMKPDLGYGALGLYYVRYSAANATGKTAFVV